MEQEEGLTMMRKVGTWMTMEAKEWLSMKRVVGMTVPVPR